MESLPQVRTRFREVQETEMGQANDTLSHGNPCKRLNIVFRSSKTFSDLQESNRTRINGICFMKHGLKNKNNEIKIQKSVTFLTLIMNHPKIIIISTQSHLQQHQKHKILRVNLTTKVIDLYTENWKTLVKEFQDTNE